MTPIGLDSVFFGDCRDTLRDLIAQGVKVQTCVTSPPYFGLRDYGHAGQLGLEPTPAAYVENMVDVFRLVRDLLADDGVLWLNLGDSYASKGGPTPTMSGDIFAGRSRAEQTVCMSNRLGMGNGIKPKDLIGIPWRVAFALQADGWYLRQDIIWHKPNPMPESVTDRCTKAHEYLFLLSKRERYYWDAAAMREEATGALPGNTSHKYTTEYQKSGDQMHRTKAGLLAYADRQRRKTTSPSPSHVPDSPEHTGLHRAGSEREPVFRNSRSVWTVPTVPYSGAHFATFPPALIERPILDSTRPGDIVLDPFFGSGTTGEVANRLGRHWIGCEINPAYAPLQRARTAQASLTL